MHGQNHIKFKIITFRKRRARSEIYAYVCCRERQMCVASCGFDWGTLNVTILVTFTLKKKTVVFITQI